MKTVIKQVEVPEAMDKFGTELKNFVVAVETALADGWQMGQDLPVIITSAVQNLVPAISDVKAAGDDLTADPVMSAKSMSLNLADMIAPLVKKPAAPSA